MEARGKAFNLIVPGDTCHKQDGAVAAPTVFVGRAMCTVSADDPEPAVFEPDTFADRLAMGLPTLDEEDRAALAAVEGLRITKIHHAGVHLVTWGFKPSASIRVGKVTTAGKAGKAKYEYAGLRSMPEWDDDDYVTQAPTDSRRGSDGKTLLSVEGREVARLDYGDKALREAREAMSMHKSSEFFLQCRYEGDEVGNVPEY